MSHGAEHDNHHDHHAMMIQDFKRRFWFSVILSVPVLLFSPFIQNTLGLESLAFEGQNILSALLASIIYFYGGRPFLTGARDEIGARKPGMMTLIGVAISVAYIYSVAVVLGISGEVFFWELATLIDVMLLGHWIEMRSVMGASRALDELAKLMPASAHRLTGSGKTEDVPISELTKGDHVIVKPGEKIPGDGIIVEGSTSINEALITGESKPVSKQEGDEVIGGSINQEGSITVAIKKTGQDSYLSRVMEMVQNAQASRSRVQNLANRSAFWLTILALGGGALTLGIWLALGQDFNFALSRMVTVMVITCPHALGLAIPLVISRSTALTARSGLLIRDRDGFESARNVDTIVLDKTGTLTEGEFAVSNLSAANGFDEIEVLSLAASVESRSEHPLARPIVKRADKIYQVASFKAIAGQGVEGKVSGRRVAVVGPSYIRTHNIDFDEKTLQEARAQSETIVFVLVDDTLAGSISLADKIRPQSKRAISQIKQMGITPVMLTGDSEAVARTVADEVGVEEYIAGVLPENKQSKIQQLQKSGRRVAMVGDGVNDAPALAAADVGIAIGAGTDVAAETADIVLVNSNPLDIVKTIRFAEKTYGKMRQNLWWATGYNVIAIPLAAGVLYGAGILLSPAVGAALMSASTVVVAINARLLRFK